MTSKVRWLIAMSILSIVFSTSCMKKPVSQPILAQKVKAGDVVEKDGWWLNEATFNMLYRAYRKSITPDE